MCVNEWKKRVWQWLGMNRRTWWFKHVDNREIWEGAERRMRNLGVARKQQLLPKLPFYRECLK